MKHFLRTVLVAAAGALVATAPVAHATSAVPLVYVSGPESSNQWTVPVLALPQGANLTYVNADTARHDFVAKEYGPDTQTWCSAFTAGHCPLFFSRFAGLSEQVPVLGLENLTPGQTYTFVCLIHPLMKGTLVAVPALPE